MVTMAIGGSAEGRHVRLGRHRAAGSFGIAIRGGHEHGTGIYISHVQPGSEAHMHRLQVGDEIVRVNGFCVQKATHQEVVNLIKTSSLIQLRVRGAGYLPVKDYSDSSVSWRTVESTEPRIYISLTGQSSLGCSICKGPADRPGIYVQSTKPTGLAREVGMRPGDQILHCNGVEFTDIDFGEAVMVLKSSPQLDLTLRRGAGADLFPAQSSGYNSQEFSYPSSDSSVNSTPPPTGVRRNQQYRRSPPRDATGRTTSPQLPAGSRRNQQYRRSPPRGSTGNRTYRRRSRPLSTHWESASQEDLYSACETYRPASVSVRPRSKSSHVLGRHRLPSREPSVQQHQRRSSGGGHVSMYLPAPPREDRWQEIEREWAESEREESCGSVTRVQIRPPPPPPLPGQGENDTTAAGLRGQGDGSSELTDEKDQDVLETEVLCPPPPSILPLGGTIIPGCRRQSTPSSNITTASQDSAANPRHDKLMLEFQQAHRRMFANKQHHQRHRHVEADDELSLNKERQGHSPPPDQLIRTRKKPFAPSPPSSITSGSPTPPGERPHILPDKQVIIESKHAGNTKLTRQGSHTSQESLHIYNTPTLAKLAHSNKPPAPKPPTSSSPGNSSGNRPRRDFVETESLDSFTLEHPRGSAPKPPATYFDGATRGATYVDGAPRGRHVLVSIGSYGDTRPAPARLPFLSSSSRHASTDETDSMDNDGSVGPTQLQDELVATLSRARLSQDSESGATQRNELQLSGSDTSAESSPGGGILKQGTGRASNKSISFGKTTMIGDVPVTVL